MRTDFSTSPALPDEHHAVSFGILSTFPPTSCGIATFSAALATGLLTAGASVQVVRCGASPSLEDPLVSEVWDDESDRGAIGAIAALNQSDLVIVQHEYGIYGGRDGCDLLDVMEAVIPPMLVVAHTVLENPTPNQRRVLESVCRLASTVVVMTETARVRLTTGFAVDADRVMVIPHGAATPSITSGVPVHERPVAPAGPRVLTWGLLGPGKGIEWAIDAMAELVDLDPAPHYVIAGATHPKVLEHEGEVYRDGLVARAAATRAHITFDDTYRDLPSLNELIRSADLVVLPYDSRDQVTSGVLVDAVAAGRPVVSTAFPHAVELLATGAGVVVPQGDAAALRDAIRRILTDPEIAAAMANEAARLAPDLSWAAVAARYHAHGVELLADRIAAST